MIIIIIMECHYTLLPNKKKSIKDKNCIYWETFNNQTINEGAYFRSSSDMPYSITNEYSTMGDYSLKAISSNWQWVYYGLPSALHNQITHPFSFKCDVYTTGGDLLIIVSPKEGAEKSTYITLSPGKYETEITYTPSEYNFQRIQLGYRSRDNEKTCYIDNIRLYIQ